jgi:AcrR family transcriptional regulator
MGPGLRTEKKSATRRALTTAAQELVLERGLDCVTVEDIAAAAGVSPRTFFNYFAGKDEALVGADRSALQSLADELRCRPASEGPADALRAVMLDDVDGMLRRWELRNQLVRSCPALLPRHLAVMVQLEEALAGALAERLGVDPDVDPLPRALVAAALAVLRATLVWWWEQSDRTTPLADALNDAYASVIASPWAVS